jgi:hypothetical protein
MFEKEHAIYAGYFAILIVWTALAFVLGYTFGGIAASAYLGATLLYLIFIVRRLGQRRGDSTSPAQE